MDTTKLIVDIVGWIGSIEILAAYALISSKRLDPRSVTYQVLNLTGGLLLMVNSLYYTAYPSVFINFVWGIIAIFAIWNIVSARNKESAQEAQIDEIG